MAAWHLCVESWLLCTPSLPPAVGAGWGETGQSHLLQVALFSPPQGTPGRCGLQAKPKGERQRRALSRLPRHLCPGAVTELAAQVFRRAGTGRSPPMADCCSCDQWDGRHGQVLVSCSRWRAEHQ